MTKKVGAVIHQLMLLPSPALLVVFIKLINYFYEKMKASLKTLVSGIWLGNGLWGWIEFTSVLILIQLYGTSGFIPGFCELLVYDVSYFSWLANLPGVFIFHNTDSLWLDNIQCCFYTTSIWPTYFLIQGQVYLNCFLFFFKLNSL